jgi:D-Tyr-tRNAtyr deacylase
VAGGRDGSATELWGMARDAMGETLAVHDTWVVANTTSGAPPAYRNAATPAQARP